MATIPHLNEFHLRANSFFVPAVPPSSLGNILESISLCNDFKLSLWKCTQHERDTLAITGKI